MSSLVAIVQIYSTMDLIKRLTLNEDEHQRVFFFYTKTKDEE
jgi:NO-binding membrane sensor protein with MHYT domain